jgi:hypothetical protein
MKRTDYIHVVQIAAQRPAVNRAVGRYRERARHKLAQPPAKGEATGEQSYGALRP